MPQKDLMPNFSLMPANHYHYFNSPTFASAASTDAASDRNSTVSCEALPAEYLLPTPHHLAESQNFGHGLSYFLDSTCDSAKSDFGDGDGADGSTRAEFPSGVEPLVTPNWLRGDGHQRVHQVWWLEF